MASTAAGTGAADAARPRAASSVTTRRPAGEDPGRPGKRVLAGSREGDTATRFAAGYLRDAIMNGTWCLASGSSKPSWRRCSASRGRVSEPP